MVSSHVQIAKELGISKDRVHLIETKTLRKIRCQLISNSKLKGLKDYLK